MADPEKKSFPYIANKNWWELRRRWLTSPPNGSVSASYLASVLNINEKVAQDLRGQLRLVGLIDDKDKLTDLALEWRHDEDYPAACAKMVKRLYPVELLDAVPPSSPDRQAATKWFMKTMGKGQVTANQKAAFYELLANGDPNAESATAPPKSAARSTGRAPRSTRTDGRPRDGAPAGSPAAAAAPTADPPAPRVDTMASVSIAVQVYIAADSSADQIEQVFASMAKHLYKR